jgi:hypothetical protein
VLVDPVDDRPRRLETTLEPLDAVADALPAGRRELHEQRQVVDAGMPLAELVSLDALEPPDHLVHQPAHLGEVAGDGQHLLAEPVLDCGTDSFRQLRFELGGRLRECLDLSARPLECCVGRGRLGASLGSGSKALQHALDHAALHEREHTALAGWTC